MKDPGPIAQKAVETALGFVGTVEQGGENRGAQVERFLKAVNLGPGNPWCAAFLRHCMEKSAGFLGKTLPPSFPDSGYCPDFKQWGMVNDLWIPVSERKAQRGDLCLFYFPAKGRVAHIGLVVSANQWGCVTVEGNTGPERDEVNREGDGVYRKNRNWGEFGVYGGFVRLPW